MGLIKKIGTSIFFLNTFLHKDFMSVYDFIQKMDFKFYFEPKYFKLNFTV